MQANQLTTACSCLLLGLISLPASGDTQLHAFGGGEMGLGTFSFEYKLDQQIVFPVANLTGGLAYGRFNLAANVSGSMQDADISEEDYTGDASRQDLDITLGYQLNRTFSLFVGYKSGETELHKKSRLDGVGSSNESYKQEGLFAGFGMGVAFENAGKLDFSVAYADLDASNRFTADGDGADPGEDKEFDDIEGRTSGDSNGFSVNLGWSIPLRGNLLFRTKVKYNRYQQDIRFEGQQFNNITEDSTMLLVGVVGVF